MLNIDLWHRFTEQFSAEIKKSSEDELASAWRSPKERTQFYRKMLKPLATSLGTLVEENLETGNELFKVDFAISRNSGDVKVPIIFIESENNPNSADHEVRKLVNLAAPLRVLITVSQWDDVSGIWDLLGGGHRSRLLPYWEQVIRQHQIIWPRAGVVGILVGEWRPNKTFRFYEYGFGEGHRLAGPTKDILLERYVKYEDPRQARAATQSVLA
jgi:muramoyltetrapeptide carboxypeptidase LdcA involved in peptidoglycan recycling